MNIHPFQVGDKVICVNIKGCNPKLKGPSPELNSLYVVRGITYCPVSHVPSIYLI